MKALVGAFNQEKALVGAFSVIVKIGYGFDGALHSTIEQASRAARGSGGRNKPQHGQTWMVGSDSEIREKAN